MSYTKISRSPYSTAFLLPQKNISSFICFLKQKTKENGLYCKIRTLTSLENSAEGAFYLASGVWMRFESDDLMLLKPRRLITDIYGPQLTRLIRFTNEDKSCGRGTVLPAGPV